MLDNRVVSNKYWTVHLAKCKKFDVLGEKTELAFVVCDAAAEYWPPAIVIPTEEVDATMPQPSTDDEFVVKLFENGKYLVVHRENLVVLSPLEEPYITFRDHVPRLCQNKSMRLALDWLRYRKLPLYFRWDKFNDHSALPKNIGTFPSAVTAVAITVPPPGTNVKTCLSPVMEEGQVPTPQHPHPTFQQPFAIMGDKVPIPGPRSFLQMQIPQRPQQNASSTSSSPAFNSAIATDSEAQQEEMLKNLLGITANHSQTTTMPVGMSKSAAPNFLEVDKLHLFNLVWQRGGYSMMKSADWNDLASELFPNYKVPGLADLVKQLYQRNLIEVEAKYRMQQCGAKLQREYKSELEEEQVASGRNKRVRLQNDLDISNAPETAANILKQTSPARKNRSLSLSATQRPQFIDIAPKGVPMTHPVVFDDSSAPIPVEDLENDVLNLPPDDDPIVGDESNIIQQQSAFDISAVEGIRDDALVESMSLQMLKEEEEKKKAEEAAVLPENPSTKESLVDSQTIKLSPETVSPSLPPAAAESSSGQSLQDSLPSSTLSSKTRMQLMMKSTSNAPDSRQTSPQWVHSPPMAPPDCPLNAVANWHRSMMKRRMSAPAAPISIPVDHSQINLDNVDFVLEQLDVLQERIARRSLHYWNDYGFGTDYVIEPTPTDIYDVRSLQRLHDWSQQQENPFETSAPLKKNSGNSSSAGGQFTNKKDRSSSSATGATTGTTLNSKRRRRLAVDDFCEETESDSSGSFDLNDFLDEQQQSNANSSSFVGISESPDVRVQKERELELYLMSFGPTVFLDDNGRDITDSNDFIPKPVIEKMVTVQEKQVGALQSRFEDLKQTLRCIKHDLKRAKRNKKYSSQNINTTNNNSSGSHVNAGNANNEMLMKSFPSSDMLGSKANFVGSLNGMGGEGNDLTMDSNVPSLVGSKLFGSDQSLNNHLINNTANGNNDSTRALMEIRQQPAFNGANC